MEVIWKKKRSDLIYKSIGVIIVKKNTRHIFRFTEEYSKEEGPITEVECTKCGNTFTIL